MRDGLVLRPISPLIRAISFNFHSKASYHSGFHYSSAAIASSLQHYIGSTSPSEGQTIHAHIVKTGFDLNTNVSIKLLILYLKCGSSGYARKVFDQMPKPTLSAYNYLIAGYFKEGRAEESLDVVRKLAFSDERPDGFTLSMVLKLSASLVLANLAKEVHTRIVKLDYEIDDVVFASLIDSYVKNGKVGYARSVFNSMPETNLVCSTALIVGYMNQGSFSDAEVIFDGILEKDAVVYNAMIEGYSKTLETAIRSLELYKTMQCLNSLPTISTFVSIIGACSLLSALEFGQQLHGQIIKRDLSCHVKSGSALIDMYAKCGRIEDARRVFDHMPEKNVFSWTSIIDGYGKNGIPHEALELFYSMRRNSDVKPNYATFLGALSACGHAGLLSSSKEIFESMEKDYKLKPRMEHYACVVDLFGRMGCLNEAYNLIRRIPEKPSTDVWAALLGASRLHGDVQMADIAAKEIFELNIDGRPGAYIALSNTFAAAGEWDGVCRVRDLMKERGISKGAGRSWVGTDEGLLGFHVGKKM